MASVKIDHPSLDLEFDEKRNCLCFGNFCTFADVRKGNQMKEVLYNVEVAKKLSEDEHFYYMYRDVPKPEDRALFQKNSIRFDITVIPDKLFGNEFNKTYGHYHALAHDNLSYTEIYEVLNGTANCLLQKKEGEKITEIYLIEARKGDKYLIPPNFGHSTINIGRDTLIVADIQERNFKSDYSFYKNNRGAGYYVLKSGTIANKNYQELPELEKIGANAFNKLVSEELSIQLKQDDMYSLFLKDPKIFEFLLKPELIEF